MSIRTDVAKDADMDAMDALEEGSVRNPIGDVGLLQLELHHEDHQSWLNMVGLLA